MGEIGSNPGRVIFLKFYVWSGTRRGLPDERVTE